MPARPRNLARRRPARQPARAIKTHSGRTHIRQLDHLPAALGCAPAPISRSQRHLMFNAEGHDVDLRIVGTNGSYVLAGQIWPR